MVGSQCFDSTSGDSAAGSQPMHFGSECSECRECTGIQRGEFKERDGGKVQRWAARQIVDYARGMREQQGMTSRTV